MAHPNVDNTTPFSFDALFLTDEEARSLLVPVIKATYAIDSSGALTLAEKQTAIDAEGKHWGDPETSSYKYEPEVAFIKMATDVVLVGHAHAPHPGATELDVGIQVGPVRKLVKVFGDRWLVKSGGLVEFTAPRPFERIPLNYEHAFGGWDHRDEDPGRPKFETRNPVGMGFRNPLKNFDEPVQVPNIEDPQRRFRGYGDTPPPAGFGFTSPHWRPRADYAGTYDEAWETSRMPLLPLDFDRRFFNAASPGLIAPGYLQGNEPVGILNASPGGRLSFHLPGVPAPICYVELRGRKHHVLQTVLDTIIIDTDEMKLFLLWRAHVQLRTGPLDVIAIRVAEAAASDVIEDGK